MSGNISTLIRIGKSQGYIRDKFNEGIFLVIFLNLVDGTINPDSLSESNYSAEELLEGIFTLMFIGALTEKGRKQFPVMRTREDTK